MKRTQLFRTLILMPIILGVGCTPTSGGDSDGAGGSGTVDVNGNSPVLMNSPGTPGEGMDMKSPADGADDPMAMEMKKPEPPAKCERRGLDGAEKVVQRIDNGVEYVSECAADTGMKDKMKITVF
jgi:hypothetical protein